MSHNSLHIFIVDEKKYEKYECLIDETYISYYKFIPNIQELYKLIKASFEEKDKSICFISEIKETEEGLTILFNYESLLSFVFQIQCKKVIEDEAQ
jgi:hypothetical protein